MGAGCQVMGVRATKDVMGPRCWLLRVAVAHASQSVLKRNRCSRCSHVYHRVPSVSSMIDRLSKKGQIDPPASTWSILFGSFSRPSISTLIVFIDNDTLSAVRLCKDDDWLHRGHTPAEPSPSRAVVAACG